MKSKRAAINILSNILSKFATIAFGIIIPKLYINYFGSEVNGLLSSIEGIFVYINLLEAGIGGASVQALYAPLSKKNDNKVNEILSATTKYYKRTGIYFLASVSVLAFIYPIITKTNMSYWTITILILLSSISSALSYFFQGKYTVLLTADNRGYVLTSFNMLFSIVSSISKIALILKGFNIITVQVVFSFVSILQVMSMIRYVKKIYPNLDLSVQQDIDAIKQKKSVMIHQIAGVIFNNTDVLILTIFCNLKIVSVYTIYSMIFIQAGYLPNILVSGVTAGFGQLYTENKDKFKRIFNFFEVYYITLVFVVFLVAYILIIPFLKLYTKGVSDINYIDYKLPLLFLVVNLLSTARMPAVVVINVAGHFKQTSWRATLEMIINLIFSITLVNIIGIYGVLLGTIAALLYRTFDMIIYSSRYLLQRNGFIPILRWIFNIVIGAIIILICKKINIEVNTYVDFAIVGCSLFIIISIVYFGIITLIEKQARTVLLEYLNLLISKFTKRKSIGD